MGDMTSQRQRGRQHLCRQRRTTSHQLACASHSHGVIPSCLSAPPSWLAAFVVMAIVLNAPSASGSHQADAARSAVKYPSLRGEIKRITGRYRRLILDDDDGKNSSNKRKKHSDKNKHSSKWKLDRKHKGKGDWKKNHGRAPKAESKEAIGKIVTAVAELETLDALDHGDTAGLELGLEEMAEDLIEATFPPGCSWSCYLENHPRLSARVGNTEAAALEHWIKHGQETDLDCSCKNTTDIEAAAEPKSVEEEEEKEAEEEEEVVENIEDIAEKIQALEGADDDAAMVEKLVLAAVEEQLIAATFPPGCTWECYLDKHPWLADHVARTEGAAYEHFARHGLDAWDCSCTEGDAPRPASGLRLQVWFSATVLLLAYWAVRQCRSLRRGEGGSAAGGAHGKAHDGGSEGPSPVEYRDTSSFEPVMYGDTSSFEIS